jgi:hypothetical protein
MKIFFPLLSAFLFFAAVSRAQTNTISPAAAEGLALTRKILAQMPTQNFSNSAVLRVQPKHGEWTNYTVTSRAMVGRGYWKNIFTSDALKPARETFTVTHTLGQPNSYTHELTTGMTTGKMLPSSRFAPFANSDFWLGDLALDFFHWPEQRVLKKEFHRNRACTVLESVNAGGEKNGYARIVSWIDNDSLAIVEAYGYDADGKLLKEFTPKTFKKVSGKWELKEIEIRNVQTGSRTRLEFDLK